MNLLHKWSIFWQQAEPIWHFLILSKDIFDTLIKLLWLKLSGSFPYQWYNSLCCCVCILSTQNLWEWFISGLASSERDTWGFGTSWHRHWCICSLCPVILGMLNFPDIIHANHLLFTEFTIHQMTFNNNNGLTSFHVVLRFQIFIRETIRQIFLIFLKYEFLWILGITSIKK